MKQGNKKILMISFRCPWPLDQGGYILRFLNIAKILAKNYEVDLLTIIEDRKEERHLDELKKIFNNVIHFYHPKFYEYVGSLKAFFSRRPLQVGYYYSRKADDWLKRNYKEYDLLFCSTIRTAEYVRGLKIKKCIDFVDALSLNYQQAINNIKGLWKLIYILENDRLLNYEKEIANIFELSFITARKDRDHIFVQKNKKIVILPNGVKEELLKREPIEKENNWLTFLGKMDYHPNEDACVFFAREVFLKIKNKVPDVKFYIVGMNPTKKVLSLQKIEGIEVVGRVNNPYFYLKRSKVIIAPIRFGGGIQNKILEGMALGKTVLTTPIGAAGITEAKDGEHLVVVDYNRPNEMAKKIAQLMDSYKTRQKIGEAARKLILEDYSWDKIEKKLVENLSLIL